MKLVKQLSERTRKSFNRVSHRVTHFVRRHINRYQLKKLLVGVPKKHLSIYETILSNQQTSCDTSYTNTYSSFVNLPRKQRSARKALILKLARKSLDNIADLFDLVGVQPLKGPVGLIYTLQYTDESGLTPIDPTTISPNASKLSLAILQHAVEAGARILQASWTTEVMEDVKSLHGKDFDPEKELLSALAAEISYELASQATQHLFRLAAKESALEFQFSSPIELGHNLSINLNKAANSVARRSRRGCGNFILTTPEGLEQLRSMAGPATFRLAESAKKNSSRAVLYVGDIVVGDSATILHKVYMANCTAFNSEQPSAESEAVFLVGYKGKSGEFDTGYVFSPYVLLLDMGIVIDPCTFQPTNRFGTRYGRSMFSHSHTYYRLVKSKFVSKEVANHVDNNQLKVA